MRNRWSEQGNDNDVITRKGKESKGKEIKVKKEGEEDPPKKYIESRWKYKLSEGSVVRITEKSITGIIEEYWETVTIEYLEKVDLYCGSNGKSYKDYGMTIRNRLSRDKIKKLDQKPKAMNASDLSNKKENDRLQAEKEIAERKALSWK